MCGICGLISFSTPQLNGIQTMNQSLSHRGPDAEGVWNDEKVAFGHRRLSIIDLSASGIQPMASSDGNLILIFNGEIYNFKELKKELIAKGHVFYSISDSEVIIYAYSQWGIDAFNRFNGMFSLAIYDKAKQQVILARDHAGIKPLYYHINNKQLLFSSEIRSFKAFDSNWPMYEEWQPYFLSFGFIPFPYTTLKDVYTLPKGHFLTLNLADFSHSIKQFHHFSFSAQIKDEKSALQQVKEALLSGVERHLISDAPLGIFLSGGIDSSLIALIADHLGHQNLNTLSITFNEASFNEEPYQDIVLKRMHPHNHKAYKVDGAMFIEHLDDIFKAMDQPSWDGVNSYFISKCAHDAGLKTVLSGLGGDELFGGYPSFNRIGLISRLQLMPAFMISVAKYFSKDVFSRLSFLNASTNYQDYLLLRGAYNPWLVSQITRKSEKDIMESLSKLALTDYPEIRNQNLAAYLETNVYMENQLLKDTDFMSMWHSLEVRVPFLDRELMELMHTIDPAVKFNPSKPKYLLTKTFEDLLPCEVVFRKKQGFTFPFSIWLKNNMDYFKPLLPDTSVTKKLTQQFMEDKIHWSRLWALIVWEKFC